MHRPVLTTFTAFVFFVLGTHAAVSATAGSIRGTVLDPDGAVVAGAQVLVTARTGVVSSTRTDEAGAFAVMALAIDRYEVVAAREGFRATPVVVDLATAADQIITVTLQVSAIAEAVVVSAAHVDQLLSRTPASTTVLARDDLRTYQHDTVAASLRRVPGLSVARTGTEGSVTSLFSRGGESDFTAVVIDGVPVNTFGGSFDFGHVTTGDVERVEVVRGPQSALWSGGAIGGVVHVITRPDANRLFTAHLDGGSRGSYRGGATAAVPFGLWQATFAGERAVSEGFTGVSPGDERVSNDDWRSEHLTAAVRREGATRVQLMSRLDRSERGYPGPFGSDPAGTSSGVDRVSRGVNDSVLLAASASRAFARVRPAAHVTWYRLDSDFDSPFGTSNSGTRRATARAQADVRLLDALDATFGAEWLDERATSTYITGSTGQTIPVDRSIGSLFGEARHGGRSWLVTGGARLERIERERLDADPNPFAPRPVLPADTVVAITPRVSVAWFARPADERGEWTRVRASAGLGIRPPDAFELAFTDNPALQPERSRSFEAGVEHALSGGLIVAEATAFANRYDDLIVTVGRSMANASQYQSDNISNARARGIELLVSGRARAGFRASFAYTWLDAEVLAVDRLGVAPPPFKPGDPLLRRPRHQTWIDASWRGSAASVFVTVGARGRTLDVDPSFGAFGGLFDNPGYGTVDAGGGWRAGRYIDVFARVTNLLDREYEEVLGFPAARRGFYAGLRFTAR